RALTVEHGGRVAYVRPAARTPVLRPSFTGDPSRRRVRVDDMARYLFASHDGFGLGHVRRNTLVARAILAREPEAEIVVVTGLPMRPAWLGPGARGVPVPALLQDSARGYTNPGMSVQQALAARSAAFRAAVDEISPQV